MIDNKSTIAETERVGAALNAATPKIDERLSAQTKNTFFDGGKCTRRTALAVIGGFPAAVLQSLGEQPDTVRERSRTDQVFLNDKVAGRPQKGFDLFGIQAD